MSSLNLPLLETNGTQMHDNRVLVTYLAQYEINSAVNLALGRIESGATIQDAFEWLTEDLERIYKGEQPSED